MITKLRLIDKDDESLGLIDWENEKDTPRFILYGAHVFFYDGGVSYHLGGDLDGQPVAPAKWRTRGAIPISNGELEITRVYKYTEETEVLLLLESALVPDVFKDKEGSHGA